MLSNKTLEPSLATDFSCLIVYAKSAAATGAIAPHQAAGGGQSQKLLHVGHFVSPRGRTASESNGRACTYASKGENEFFGVCLLTPYPPHTCNGFYFKSTTP